ncbi:hypothetical protein TruAng_003285 [Truncatella angustata]|nr:hypothetical protein TruAng_003285 [Truncatella angustata]
MAYLQAPPRGVIFDLGDVLFKWSANTTTTIPARKLRDILSTPVWHGYERGEMTRDACYELSARQFSIPASEIAEAFAQARQSLESDHTIVSFLRELKDDPTVQVYAMSNVGKEDFEELAAKMDWPLFDQVFTSAAAGMRKPELGFYRHVLDHIGLAGHQVVFIDDKNENIQAAKALGIRGLVFGPSTIHTLRDMFDSPASEGWSGIVFADNFAKLLIMDSLQDRSIIDLEWGSKKTWNFFVGENLSPHEPSLVPGGYFPDDLDTTSLALSVLRPSSTKTVTAVLDTMAEYVNDDGTFQTYFDRNRTRIDPIVSTNILACFYTYNRGHELERTLQYVHSVLLNRSYMQGTRYYPSPDCCLGFIGRLLRSSNDPHLQMTLGPLLKLRVRERLNLGGSALDLAMRVITCTHMGVACENDRRALLDLQREDGSWDAGWMYHNGNCSTIISKHGYTWGNLNEISV